MSPEAEQELERTLQLKGFRYGLHDFLAELGGAEALREHNEHSLKNYLKKTMIDPKTRELLYIVSCVAQKDRVSHIQLHMHAAVKAGSTPDEIMAVIELVGGNIGGVAKIGALEAWRATFRPDIPTIDRVVELR